MDLYNGDCLEILPTLPTGSVDMVLADLPYGVTKNKWDEIIPLAPLWRELRRVAKPRAAIVLTATQPFASMLITSNPKMFRYDLILVKNSPTGHLNANKMPMRAHECALVFYGALPVYNPQKTVGEKPSHSKGTKGAGKVVESDNNYNEYDLIDNSVEHGNLKYPISVLKFDRVPPSEILHPTQKPVALMSYFVKTYTNKGMVVLDNAMGVGTTGVSCKELGREFIGIEKEKPYFDIGMTRIDNTVPLA